MRTIYFLFSFLICSLNLLGQTDSVSTEYKKGGDNTYVIKHFLKYKSVSVFNKIHPFTEENEVTWQDWYDIDTKAVWNLSQYIKPFIGSYLKNVTLTKEDVFMVTIWFDLQGNPASFIFDYPSKLNIPITVIEQIETSLKANGKVKVTPTQYAHNQKIYYLQLGTAFNLKELQDQLNKPVEPTWNSDIVVRLGQFYPTSNSFANRYDARSSQYLYSDMFNFTDDSNTTEANIYISGTGEAVISLDLM